MAFLLESTYDGAATILDNKVLMTDSEAGTYGEAMVITSGRLTKCGATGSPVAILTKTTEAGTDVPSEYIRVREEQVWLADTTGTFSLFAVGQTAVQMDATGLLVNAAQLTGGKIEILGLDSVRSKVRCRFLP